METKLMLIGFLTKFDISRTQVPLRMTAKFLYEPYEENLVLLKEGGIKFGEQWNIIDPSDKNDPLYIYF